MKPVPPIATNVKIGRNNILDLVSRCKVSLAKISAAIISSHKPWLALSFLFIFPVAGRGSSVAIIVSDGQIVIAADGLMTETTNNIISHHRYCKIRSEGTVFYTAVGTYALPEINFDLWALAQDAIRKSKTVDTIYDVIQPSVLARLPNLISRSKVIDKLDYDSWLRGNPVITISFATIQRGVPTVATINFALDRAGKISTPTRRTQYGKSGAVQNAFLGHNDEMREMIAPSSWGFSFLRDPIGFAQVLIQREIDASARDNRNDVGPPISIMRITPTGGRLEVGYEGACR